MFIQCFVCKFKKNLCCAKKKGGGGDATCVFMVTRLTVQFSKTPFLNSLDRCTDINTFFNYNTYVV